MSELSRGELYLAAILSIFLAFFSLAWGYYDFRPEAHLVPPDMSIEEYGEMWMRSPRPDNPDILGWIFFIIFMIHAAYFIREARKRSEEEFIRQLIKSGVIKIEPKKKEVDEK